ncbi:DegV family protein [Mycoplasma phocoenae]|uniref:DegV family EDD domain-containing protein n=1 Tax=Mycoplasma phocoenae TaxID=754517 RepID=A0A858U5N0_9MOLU|nr:DegV family protein [Mycoplasma phocoenae]QJG66737.1 DegV family EDD domain-containing protein [Mycoplasma phocoenae]
MNRKIGIILDSFCGLTQKEVNDLGFDFIPLQVIINGKNNLEGINITNLEVRAQIESGKKVQTSLPPYAFMENLMQNLNNKYDHIYVLPINSALSSEFNHLCAIANSINPDKFTIFNNNFVSKQYIIIANKIIEMNENGKSHKDILNFLESQNNATLNYIIPANLDAFVSGGRLSNYKKIIMTSLKLIPILKNNDGVTATGVKRTMKSAILKAMEKLLEYIGGEKNLDQYNFWIVHTGIQKYVDIVESYLAELDAKPIFSSFAAASVLIHAGIDAISIGISKKI